MLFRRGYIFGGPFGRSTDGPTGGPHEGTFIETPGNMSGGPSSDPSQSPALTRKATLLLAKSLVSPIPSTMVPRSEFQSLTILMRGLVTVASVMAERP